MIAAAALLLTGLSVTQADTDALRQAVEPRWTLGTQTRPIELSYQREPGQMIAGSARSDFALDPATTVFMQARKQKQETQWESPKGLAKSSRAVAVGFALRW